MSGHSSERLRILFCDHLNIIRGKYVPVSKSASGESRFSQGVFGVHFDKDLLPSPGSKMMEGLPDMEARWSPDDIRQGWERNTQVVLSDLFDTEGAPLSVCGRGALRKAVADWGALGLKPKIGLELECFAFQKNKDGALVPYDTPGAVVYGTGPFTDPAGFMDAIWDKAHELGLPLEMMTAEYDAPQFEFTLTFDDAVQAVDDSVLFRLMAREVALSVGVHLTFMPKPILEVGGSGMHINVSFEGEKGNNALANGDIGGPDHLNDLAKGCLAGWMHHHKGLAGLIAPTVNSYQRLQPASMSGYWQNWGGDHRGVTARISSEGGAKARLEHRMADGAANPYTAVAAVLQAARLGVVNGYDLQPVETGDCFETQDATVGGAENLTSAMQDLAADTILTQAVGQMLADNQIFMRGAEVDKVKKLDGTALRDFYIHCF